jgi:hypothetical protein
MSRLVRWPFRLFNRFKHKKAPIQRFAQGGCSGLGTSQIGNNYSTAINQAIGANTCSGSGQANVYQANYMAEARDNLKNYYGAANSNYGQQFFAQSYNSGLGSNISGHSESPLFKHRFGRSCRAFVKAWRSAS